MTFDFWSPLTDPRQYDLWKLASPDDYQDAHHQEELDQQEQEESPEND
jgi:hypothetical protein